MVDLIVSTPAEQKLELIFKRIVWVSELCAFFCMDTVKRIDGKQKCLPQLFPRN